MTTTVTINASCNAETQVSILVEDDGGAKNQIIKDGESATITIYDDIKVTVRETPIPEET